MPAANQYSFQHRELLELMIKECGVHDGKWMLTLTFNFTGGNFGMTEEDTMPGGLVTVRSVGISKVEDDVNAPPGLVLDAAKVNPGS